MEKWISQLLASIEPVLFSSTKCQSFPVFSRDDTPLLCPDCKPRLGFPPNVLLINSREKNLTRFQLVQPQVCKQLSNQKEPVPGGSSPIIQNYSLRDCISLSCFIEEPRAREDWCPMCPGSTRLSGLIKLSSSFWLFPPSPNGKHSSGRVPAMQKNLLCNRKGDYRNHT